MLSYVIIALCAVTVWLYLYWRHTSQYWSKRGVPHLPPHPVLGSLTFLQRQNPALWLQEIYERFNSPYVGLWLVWRPALLINCPEIARRVLVKDADNFRNRFLSSGNSDPIGQLNLFTVKDPVWTYLRKRLTPVFTSSKLKHLNGLVTEKGSQLIQRIHNEINKHEPINLRAMYSDYTTDIIGTSAFGVTSDATLDGKSHLRDITKEFMKFSIYRGLAWSSIFFFPKIVDVFRFSFFPKSATDYLKKVYRAMVEQRKGDLGRETKDLLDALLKIQEDSKKNNEEISEDMLISQAAIFLQGGFDTSASALTFMTYEVAHQPHIQDKLYKEILEATEKYSKEELNSLILFNGLPYMNCVIDETLRKYPPMGWLDRVAVNNYKIDSNLTIAAGTPVYVNAIGMHYDPKYFPQPKKFDPERFLYGSTEPFTYMPFGEGPRICIGQRFAYITMRKAMAAIFLNFEVRPLPNTPKPDECEIEKKGMFLMPGQVMSVEFVPRKRPV
ncbi:cytochrome P450 6k1-like [Achroia grisella]|uniref:cytochrome P450 6k1-like n=1 Tax=Achroia grisella TaxID=688607 RepID=UPI0027D2F04B|nr:cytochrome P450 6k1-like [Achroia grisella]XP_059047407.1 cytochrome P450 6k1-like [Achroia grisella]